MDQQATASTEKKGVLDSLDREELVRKCKGLLGIAQKAKKAKDELASEVAALKEKLTECDTQKQADKECLKTMQVMVNALTENKLEATIRIADLEKSTKTLNQQLMTCNNKLAALSELEIANEAKNKQIKRLTDENEEQEIDLRRLDEKLAKVSELSQRQTQELLVLEQSIDRWKAMEAAHHKIQLENRELQSKLESLQNVESQATTMAVDHHESIVSTLQAERDENKRLYDEAKSELANLMEELNKLKELNDSDTIDVLKEKLQHENEQLKKKCEEQAYKLDKYKAKICEFSSKLKDVKQSKKVLADTVFEYSKSVTKWQVKIAHASKLLVNEVTSLSEAKDELEKQLESSQSLVGDLRKTIEDLEIRIEEATRNNETGDIKERYEVLLADYKSIETEIQQKNEEIDSITQEWHQMCATLKEENEKQSAEIESLNQKFMEKMELYAELEEKEAAATKKNMDLAEEVRELNDVLKSKDVIDGITEKYETLMADYKAIEKEIQEKNEEIVQITQDHQQTCAALKDENEQRRADIGILNQTLLDKSQQITELEEREAAANKKNMELLEELRELNEDEMVKINDKYEALMADYKAMEKDIQEKNEEIAKIMHNNQEALKEEMDKHRAEIDRLNALLHSNSQSLTELEEKETINNKKNTELLAEMRELNDVLKTRGEVISNQTTEIDQINAKLSEQEQINEDKIKQIASLEESLKEKSKQIEQIRNQFDNQSEILSTSTISRADEVARMRDIEDSFEEKYNKLRALALKLKKKIAEQQGTIAKLEAAASAAPEPSPAPTPALTPTPTPAPTPAAQNIISLQKDNDRLLDQIDSMKSEQKQFKSQINQLTQQIKKLEEESKSLRIVNEDIKVTADTNQKIKSALDERIRADEKQIETLKNDNKNVTQKLKNAENEIIKTKDIVKQKESEIALKTEEVSKIKAEMNKVKASIKKHNVLNLEVEAYEKSLSEMSQKFETTSTQLSEARSEVEKHQTDTKKLTAEIQSLKSQLELEKENSSEYQQQNELQRIKLKENSAEISELKRVIDDHVKETNQIKIELTNLQSQQSENEVDKQRFISKLKTENEKNVTKILSLEEETRDLRIKLNTCEQELANVQTEFASYKVRAQAVLRQNQSKDSSNEEELKEEIAMLTQTKDDLNAKLANTNEHQRRLENTIDELKGEKTNLQERSKKLLQLLDETRQQIESIQADNRQQTQEHHEALKMQRLQIDTLNNCFKNQIEEMQKKHSDEIAALKSNTATKSTDVAVADTNPSLARGAQLTTEQRIELLMMERQDGEGSECTSATQSRKVSTAHRGKHELIPLDELLNNTFDEETEVIDNQDDNLVPKEKFEAQQSRVKHLSSLLSEAEMDVARLTEMNTMLKEEMRRQERSTEREKQMQNLEYIKNVIFKFLTINNADERGHLVPVLNTILKLSPDENKTLQSVARGGDGSQSSWSNLLPTW